jgi:hypothetical protein
MKIEIEGKEYEIDINRAKELGLCKETPKKITDFSVGDVFESKQGSRIIIIQCLYSYSYKYNIAGNYGLYLYSDFGKNPLNQEQMLDFLNKHEYKFIKNINSDIETLISK